MEVLDLVKFLETQQGLVTQEETQTALILLIALGMTQVIPILGEAREGKENERFKMMKITAIWGVAKKTCLKAVSIRKVLFSLNTLFLENMILFQSPKLTYSFS